MKDYIQKIRTKIGKDKFIHPAARIIIENNQNEILIIHRRDNGKYGLPAGALEENETIEQCIIREVKEETGLLLKKVEVIGISSDPELESVDYPNGDRIQYFTIEFYANQWEGVLRSSGDAEIRQVLFISQPVMLPLPDNERSIFDSLKYYRSSGKILVK